VTLAQRIAARLEQAGITPVDPGLLELRAWNAAIYRSARQRDQPADSGQLRQRRHDIQPPIRHDREITKP
jgi:hypothetical protein